MTVIPSILGGLPIALREELVQALVSITKNFSEGRWEPSELNGESCAKLCIRSFADMPMVNFLSSKQTQQHGRECQKLEQETQLPRSLRIQIPEC